MGEASFTLVSPPSTSVEEESAAANPGGGAIGSGLTDATGNALPAKLDHCAEGLGHLLDTFKDKPRLEAFICSFLDQVQDLEDAYRQLFVERTLDVAVGVQLDGLGAIVGEPRRDRGDDIYRKFIRVRILVNRSNGRVEELYSIAKLAMGDASIFRVQEQFPANVLVEMDSTLDGIDPDDLFRIFTQAKGAGVGLTFVFTWEDETSTLILDTTPAGTSDTTGLGSTVNASLGGGLASVLR